MAEPSSGRSDGKEVVLHARGNAWGLPTACPFCLPIYTYLKLADVDFSIFYNDAFPDSDDVPALEYGDSLGLPNESAGIVGFLKSQEIADLDAGFSNAELAQLRSFSALIQAHLQSALLCELWDQQNSKVANRIYFKELPWPISKILYWKQQGRISDILGIRRTNLLAKTEELERKAVESYESLSTLLGDKKFFMNSRPSSLDALFLSHALIVLHLPLEGSMLKEELLRHDNLVKYTECLRKEFLEGPGTTPVIKKSFFARTTRTPRHSSSAKAAHTQQEEPKERSEKVKRFKKRAKFFLAAQALALLAFLYIWGVSVIEDSPLEEEYNNDELD